LQSFWVRAITASVVLCSPIAFASIIFIRSFAAAQFSGEALGSNILGAVVGGIVEGASLWSGIRSLLILAAGLYVISYFCRETATPGKQGFA
jgi:hypothetical protein